MNAQYIQIEQPQTKIIVEGAENDCIQPRQCTTVMSSYVAWQNLVVRKSYTVVNDYLQISYPTLYEVDQLSLQHYCENLA